MTLIEVVVSLGLLSTLLVGILVAYHRHAERILASQQSLTALDGIDRLMCGWTSQRISAPYPAHGELPGKDGFVWRTEAIETNYHEPLGIDIVRLDVFREESASAGDPIASIDLAVPHVKSEVKGAP